MQKKKSIAYIDSRNIICSIEELGLDSHRFNYKGLAEKYLTENGKYSPSISIKLYGAVYPVEWNSEKHHLDIALYKRLETDGFQIQYGHMKKNDESGVTEKGVDVRLAVDLVVDGFFQNSDFAYIFSSDTDLVPAIQQASKHTKIFVCLNHNMNHLRSEFEKAGARILLLTRTVMASFAYRNTTEDLVTKFNGKKF